jgi:acylphosphatase
MTLKHYKISISGKVQGVFFRQGTKAVADQLGLSGWVKNEKDGSVSIAVQGDAWLIENFLDWCKEGPDRAVVEDVKIEEGGLEELQNFIVKK